jgi:CheY-like chemotaxis protein
VSATPFILHVEDDPNDVLLIQRAFRKSQFSVMLKNVSDGEMATQYLAGDAEFADRAQFPLPSLMLLDLKLPRKNGFEVLGWLRSQPSPLNRLPVVVLSSSNQPADVNRAYEAGANAYMVKPAGFDALLETVKVLAAHWLVHSEKPEVQKT